MTKLYIYLSLILATIAGFIPVLIGKFTDHGDEICDPELYYSDNRVCEIALDRAVLFFITYFILIMVVMAVIYGIGRFLLYLSRKSIFNRTNNKSNQRKYKLTIIIFTVLTAIFCVSNLDKLGELLFFFYTYIGIFLIIHLTLQIIASQHATATMMKFSIISNVLIIFALTICPGFNFFDGGVLFNPAVELIGIEPQGWHTTLALISTFAAGICSLFTFLLSRNKVD